MISILYTNMTTYIRTSLDILNEICNLSYMYMLHILFSICKYFTLTIRITGSGKAPAFLEQEIKSKFFTALGIGISICMHKQSFGTVNFRFNLKEVMPSSRSTLKQSMYFRVPRDKIQPNHSVFMLIYSQQRSLLKEVLRLYHKKGFTKLKF